jgi:hypothetical protein
VVQEEDPSPTDISDDVTLKYHKYDNNQEAKTKINKHLPISVTQHVSGKFYMHLKPKRMTNTHAALELMPYNYIQRHMDVDYVKFQFGDEVKVLSSADDPITMYCLLLPRSRQHHVFCMINEDWQELRYNGVTHDLSFEYVE